LGQDEEETTTVVVKMTARLDETGGGTTLKMESAISKLFSWAPSVDEVSSFEPLELEKNRRNFISNQNYHWQTKRGSLTPRTQESEEPKWKIFEEAVKKAANSVVQPKDASQPKTNFEVHVKKTHGSILYDNLKKKNTIIFCCGGCC